MRRVWNASKGFVGLALVLFLVGVAVYIYEQSKGYIVGWLALGFIVIALLAYQWLVFKWLFFVIPFFLRLHPYPHMGVVVAGIPFYLKISIVLYLIDKFLKEFNLNLLSPIIQLSFGETLFLYLVALLTATFVSRKVLRYRGKHKATVKGGTVAGAPQKAKKQENFWENLVERISTLSNQDFSGLVGQDRAIAQVIKTMKVAVKQLGHEEKRARVLASMIFVGATGVGKTETAKILAKILEPLGYQFIRIDLNQYRTPESAWTLIGSPRGYVGSEQGGTLTRALMKNTKAVILFDEMEKAHPELHTTFMTLLDEGYIEEQSTGRKVYLQGSIVIFTSNLYSEQIAEIAEEEEDEIELELRLRNFVETYFGRPELVGRIDAIIPYRRLSQEDLEEIARRVLTPYGKAYLAHELTVELSELTKKYGIRMFVRKLREIAVSDPEQFLSSRRRRKFEEKDSGGIELFDIDIGGEA